MKVIKKYFPELDLKQLEKFRKFGELYNYWNNQINLISRKDIQNLYIRHILHSLAIAKIISFKDHTKILDVGTGGGFPGIPLAILFFKCQFHLVDSIGKKIMVVNEFIKSCEIENVTTQQIRIENYDVKYDFIIGRAVTPFPDFVELCRKNIRKISLNKINNGIFYYTGEKLDDKFISSNSSFRKYSCSTFFNESFFETKKIFFVEK